MKRDECSDQEKWVLERLEKGEGADLKENFGEGEENRTIRSRFIEDLLTGNIEGFTCHRKGIRIARALIEEPLILESLAVPHNVFFRDCIFKDQVYLWDSCFSRHLHINGTKFYQKADFQGIKVGLNLSCKDAIFKESLNFLGANIGGLFIARGMQVKDRANFNAMKVGQSAFFDYSVFHGLVDFGGADIGGQFLAQGSNFLGKGKNNQAIFIVIKVGQIANLDNAIFQGPVDFRGANIRGRFVVREARFEGQGKEDKADFSTIKVEQSTIFNGTVFLGPVDFSGASISGDFLFDGANFNGRGQNGPAIFNGLKVGLCASFDNAVFHGPVDLRGGEICGEFWAIGAHFKGEGEENLVKFNGLKVQAHAFFRSAVFHGKVDFDFLETGGSFYIDTESGQQETTFIDEVKFGGATIGGQFLANRARFSKNADFGGLRVRDRGIFNESVFEGNVSFNYAFFKDLEITGGRPFNTLNLSYARIERELVLAGLTLSHFEAWNLHSKGSANLCGLIIKESCSMQDSSFLVLNLCDVIWPPQQKIWLEGLTYKTISAGDKDGDWHKLLDWIEGSRFNIQPYAQLEDYFKSCGHKERADDVFFAMKKREEEIATNPWPTFKNFFLRWTVGYGRRPWRALAWSALCACFGIWLFWNSGDMVVRKARQDILVPQSKEIVELRYDPVMYSLDLFLPIELGMAKHWEPNPEWRVGWYYSKIQIILGWVLISVLLAALTGIIK